VTGKVLLEDTVFVHDGESVVHPLGAEVASKIDRHCLEARLTAYLDRWEEEKITMQGIQIVCDEMPTQEPTKAQGTPSVVVVEPY
jgi:hypothetical protein